MRILLTYNMKNIVYELTNLALVSSFFSRKDIERKTSDHRRNLVCDKNSVSSFSFCKIRALWSPTYGNKRPVMWQLGLNWPIGQN